MAFAAKKKRIYRPSSAPGEMCIRDSPKINAVSTLLFVTVLILLVIVNVREAHQAKAKNAARS